MRIGDSIQIANSFTKFSEKNWAYKIRTKDRIRRFSKRIEGYHKDKFGTIQYFERSKHRGYEVDKVYFNIDSGYRTWRLQCNINRYYEPAGSAAPTYGWTDDKHEDDDESFFDAVGH